MGTFIFNTLKIIDIYGYKFPLRYKEETQYNTICGIFFSIISISLITLLIFYYAFQIINKSNFSLVTNYIYSNENIEIDLSSFPLMIGLNRYELPIEINNSYVIFRLDRNIYTPIKNKSGYSILNRTSIPIELEQCTLESFGSYKNLFEKYEYRLNLCVKPNQNLLIKGRHDDQVRGYENLELHLIKCENLTENKCKRPEEIDNFLENSYISLFYISQTTNHFNVKNPINTILNSDTFAITLEHVKRYYYFFSKEKYNSDNGLIFNNNKEFNLFQYHHTHFDFIEKETQYFYSIETLIEINFTCHDLKTEYKRIYIKLQDVLSNIGGIFDIISTIFQFISYNFVKKSFILGIGNSFLSSNCKSITNFNTKNNCDFSNQNILQIHNKCSISSIPLKSKYLSNTNICSLFKVKIKNIILDKLNIKNEDLKIIQDFQNKKKNLMFYIFYFFCPFLKIQNLKKIHALQLYNNIFRKCMSIDFLIPMILHSYQSL